MGCRATDCYPFLQVMVTCLAADADAKATVPAIYSEETGPGGQLPIVSTSKP
jgi:hypothetical protein